MAAPFAGDVTAKDVVRKGVAPAVHILAEVDAAGGEMSPHRVQRRLLHVALVPAVVDQDEHGLRGVARAFLCV